INKIGRPFFRQPCKSLHEVDPQPSNFCKKRRSRACKRPSRLQGRVMFRGLPGVRGRPSEVFFAWYGCSLSGKPHDSAVDYLITELALTSSDDYAWCRESAPEGTPRTRLAARELEPQTRDCYGLLWATCRITRLCFRMRPEGRA